MRKQAGRGSHRLDASDATGPHRLQQAMQAITAIGAVALGSGMLLGPVSTAHAYRTLATEAELGLPIQRSATRVQITILEDGGTTRPTTAEVEAALVDATEAWTLPCADFQGVLVGPSGHAPDSSDGVTTIAVVRSGWTDRGYSPTQAANTEAVYEEHSNAVVLTDADVFINADTIDWSTGDLDLRAVLTHELGHALFGLTHPCGGSLGPDCTPAISAAAIMHPIYQVGAWEPRPDDVAGACSLTFEQPCEGLVCAADEYCDGQACVQAPSCADGERCEGVCGLGGPTRDMCIDPGSQGAPCASGDDCAGRLCLTARAISYCTRSCTAADECTVDQVCRPVEGVLVCAPPIQSGCSVVATHPTTGWWRVLFPFVLLTLALRTRSGRR